MADPNALSLPDLFRFLTGDAACARALDAALQEDLDDTGDVTTASIVDPAQRAEGRIVARRGGVIAGLELVPLLAERIEKDLSFQAAATDGEVVEAGRVVGVMGGSFCDLLTLERTMLNYLGRLSGVATLTRAFVQAVEGTGASIHDTRKTTPGLRRLERYAVRCGGGRLHRMGLYDAALYKDNHLAHFSGDALADVLVGAIEKARHEHELQFVEVEVDTLDQLDRVLSLPAGLVDIILLDNMSQETMRVAVRRRDEAGAEVVLEASGGITLDTVRAVAETGVERIAVGAITHSAPCLDIALDVAP